MRGVRLEMAKYYTLALLIVGVDWVLARGMLVIAANLNYCDFDPRANTSGLPCAVAVQFKAEWLISAATGLVAIIGGGLLCRSIFDVQKDCMANRLRADEKKEIRTDLWTACLVGAVLALAVGLMLFFL